MNIVYNKSYKSWSERGVGDGYITFFTPTYNRSVLLDRLFDCLKNQTDQHFVWILVNDGSSDDTDGKADTLLKKELFPILYISKDNGHKHSCFKVALDHCKTEFFVCMDDDDLYSENSVEFLLQEWTSIKIEGKYEIGAIRTLAQKEDGSFVSNIPIPPSEIGKKMDVSTLERNYVQNIYQENWTCYETKKLREVDIFPQDYWLKENHRYFAEVIWQGRFARKYICRYINIALRQYTEDTSSSIMRDGKGKQHYLDAFISQIIINNEQYDYIKKSKIRLLHYVLLVNLLRSYLGYSLNELLVHTSLVSLKILYVVTSPLGLLAKPIINYRRNR